MNRNEIILYCDSLLESERFKDYCPNGLQVEGAVEINKIATAVSVTQEVLNQAISSGCQMLITHHGILWHGQNDKPITGVRRNRLKQMLTHDLNLISYHLPLDAHNIFGNNAIILEKLGAKINSNFGKTKGKEIGKVGVLPSPLSPQEFEKLLNTVFNFDMVKIFPDDHMIQRVAVISGGAPRMVEETLDIADVFISGEIAEDTTAFCHETKQHFISMGHYNSETFGIKALGEHLKKTFNIPVEFIDVINHG
jgi:dinuclear metal center YbgI/SA1388 family protein